MNSLWTSDTIRIITVSGRIASGSTTLAKELAKELGWKHIEGGEIFWEAIRKRLTLNPKETNLRPDEEDVLFDKQLRHILENDSEIVLETKLAGFNAQGIDNVYKVLVICEDNAGNDQTQIRIDRLVNREGCTVDEAKVEVIEREHNDLEKWRKLYANNDQEWTYYTKSYYDQVVNTYQLGKDQALKTVLEKIKD